MITFLLILLLDMGADEIVVVDMHLIPVHPQYINRPSILYSCPPVDLGGFMDFNKDTLERNKRLGYLMAYKLFGNYEGNQYTFLLQIRQYFMITINNY